MPAVTAEAVAAEMRKLADPAKAAHHARFFKTAVGEYGEGDLFIGLTVPQTRSIVKQFVVSMTLPEIENLLHSDVHEERLAALLMMVAKFKRADDATRTAIYNSYLSNSDWINSWDLVDSSAPNIVGSYLATRDRSILDELAVSTSLWERRIAILSTFHFIRQNDFDDALRLSETLLDDEHDLIHKAVGWMLREIGKRDRSVLEDFLDEFGHTMPRTSLRYAIEHFGPAERKAYLARTALPGSSD